jgi:germination protein YpeB
MEGEFPETPTLIYDGPFSQHITSMTPRLIENQPAISQEQAVKIAADFCGVDKSRLSFLYERATTPTVYAFSSNDERDSYYIEVTKQGGVVLNMMNSRVVDSSSLSKEDAVDIAQKFLSSKGYVSMQTSYVIQQQNVVTINFAYTQDDVICYTDLAKVSVALDRGQVVGFEALGYVMSHYERDIPTPEVDADTAQEKVSKNLTVLSHALTIIPTDGKNEVFCHEFKCQNGDGQHYIVYINAITGNEQRILILLEDENGTLTI